MEYEMRNFSGVLAITKIFGSASVAMLGFTYMYINNLIIINYTPY